MNRAAPGCANQPVDAGRRGGFQPLPTSPARPLMQINGVRRVDLTDDCRTTIYAAARRLLADGADPAGTIETWRSGKLSMSGRIGDCAKLTVSQNDHGNPSLQFSKWRPFPAVAVRPHTGEMGGPVVIGAKMTTWACKRRELRPALDGGG